MCKGHLAKAKQGRVGGGEGWGREEWWREMETTVLEQQLKNGKKENQLSYRKQLTFSRKTQAKAISVLCNKRTEVCELRRSDYFSQKAFSK